MVSHSNNKLVCFVSTPFNPINLPPPDITIIIVNYKTPDYVIDCIASVENMSNNFSYEIIVVDNASRDGSCDTIRQHCPNVMILENKFNVGFAAANNIAFHFSNSKNIVLLNSDTLLLNNALYIMLDFLNRNPSVGLCGPRLYNKDLSIQKSIAEIPSIINRMENIISTQYPAIFDIFHIKYNNKYDPSIYDYSITRRIEGAALTGACLMFRKDILCEIGYLDENFFFYLEEVDWSLGAIKKGWEIWLVSDAHVMHYHMGSVNKILNTDLELNIKCKYIESLNYFFLKHYGLLYSVINKVVFFPIFTMNVIRRLFAYIIYRENVEINKFKLLLALHMFKALIKKK